MNYISIDTWEIIKSYLIVEIPKVQCEVCMKYKYIYEIKSLVCYKCLLRITCYEILTNKEFKNYSQTVINHIRSLSRTGFYEYLNEMKSKNYLKSFDKFNTIPRYTLIRLIY